jgi:hypothetical protein
MARETTVKLILNLKSSQQAGRYTNSRPQGSKEEIEKKTFEAVNYAINDIAIKAAKSQQRNVQRQLESKMTGIVMKELSDMGRKIASSGIGLGGQARSPRGGSLAIEGPISRAFSAISPTNISPMSIQAVTGMWRERTQEYLRRKSKKYGHRKWWINTGDLKSQLISPRLYIGAYGPIRVRWIPERIETSYKTGAALRYSNMARGVGRSYHISVGHINMTVLGRITPQMLAAPGEPAYNSKFSGLFDSMPQSVQNKLEGRWGPRVLVEPFLTFYLNRQIPNRVFSELEKSMKPIGVSR